MRIAGLVVVSLIAVTSLGADAPLTPPPFRLPTSVRPTKYALDLKVVPAQPTYSGSVTIDLAIDAPAAAVWLHAVDLAIDGAEVRAGGTTSAARVVPAPPDLVGFAPVRPLAAGKAQLVVRFHGKMDSEKSRGLYRVSEGAGPDDWYAYTFFEPIDARRTFPCFDEPSFKVPWNITLHVKKSHVALGNAAVASEKDEPDGMKAVTLAESRPLPSYLVAFVVGPFDLVDGGKGGRANTPIRFIVPRGRGGETRYAREVTGRIVKLLEDHFDMAYPFGKLDVAVVPRFWGTMEHPGIVALGQPLTLIKPTEEGLHRKQAYANTAIHELAHYWFGDVVTCKWWDDVWLNESLGTWLDTKITDQLEPSWKFALGRDGQITSSAMGTDGQPTAQKIRLPVTTNDAIQNSFDNDITYFKGASMLRMLESWVGHDKFRGAIRKYIRAHQWGNADEVDFLAALKSELGAPVAEVMASFVEQPGVPIVSVEPRCDGGKPRAVLTQKRFFTAGDRPSPARWKIPVCMRWGGDGGGGQMCTLLEQASAEVALPSCPKWVMPNVEAAGYYHSRYDGRALAALEPVFASSLTVRERVMMAADVAAEAEQGTLPLGDAFKLVPSFLRDEDLRVFDKGVSLLFLTNPRELGDSERAAFGRAVVKLVGARARTVGWAPKDGEDPAMASVRPMLLSLVARYGGDSSVIAEARALADKWIADRKAVAPDMVQPVLMMAAYGEDPKLFDRLVAEARKVSDRRERTLLLGTLGVFRSPSLSQRALALLPGKEFDLRDTMQIAYRSIYDRVNRETTWSFLKKHFDALTAKMREDEAMWFFGGVPNAFCDEKHRKDVDAFLTPRAKTHTGAPHALEDALESARTCELALARNRPAISAFLKQF
ncbi:MAG: Membrane alanine aminopeptidase [Myxococcales bacterium]|nr:Membrane alanine aminopeptidase [Myxococcales bacterium]